MLSEKLTPTTTDESALEKLRCLSAGEAKKRGLGMGTTSKGGGS